MQCSDKMSVTKVLAKHLVETSYDDLPKGVIEKAKLCILDSLGCAIGGYETESGKIVVDLMKHLGGKPESTIVGDRDKISCDHAAFANAALANALDFDDVYIGHPGMTVIPSAFAVGEKVNASGEELITAVVLGYDVSLRIGAAMRRPSIERRLVHGHCWQTFGAAASAAKLLGLNEPRVLDAMGIAGSNAPLPSEMKSTYNVEEGNHMDKNNSGTSAEVGITATLLAKRGFKGPHNILDGKTGFFRMCGAEKCDFHGITYRLGEEYMINRVSFKQYPACHLVHSAIEASLKVIHEHNIAPNDIKKIVIRTSAPVTSSFFLNPEPRHMVHAQFSTLYTVAVAVHGIPYGPKWYAKKTLRNPSIIKLAKKIKVLKDTSVNEANQKDPNNIITIAKVYVKGGVYGHRVEFPRGTPNNPLTRRRIEEKFESLALESLGKRKVMDIIKHARNFEKLQNVGELTALLHMS